MHAPASSRCASGFTLWINGVAHEVAGAPPTLPLLRYLRDHGWTGSKEGCAEGDCGACSVALVTRDAAGRPALRTLNSCITPLAAVAGREIVTVEGVACGDDLHPLQEAMVRHYGSQCGFCTPGFVVSSLEAWQRPDCRGPEAIADQLCGNLCRCTGYRPIREAVLEALSGPRPVGSPAEQPAPVTAVAGTFAYSSPAGVFYRPTSLPELWACWEEAPDAVLVAGATEIGVEINKKGGRFPALISTEAVPELKAIRQTDEGWFLGGAATLTEIAEAMGGAVPALAKMWPVFASRQIRNRATLGGNLATASPIGDSAPVLLALDAELVLASAAGERRIGLADFFTGYRQTVLRSRELIQAVLVPAPQSQTGVSWRADSFKVSRRREMDISIVAAGFQVGLDAEGRVLQARLAYGGVAPTPARAWGTEAWLVGRRLDGATIAEAARRLEAEFQPISDVRGSAAYRRRLVGNLWRKFAGDEPDPEPEAPSSRFGHWGSGTAASHSLSAGRSLPHDSARLHVTGRARYVDDRARERPMLEIWPVMAPHARARIIARDAAAARAMPGVRAVVMAEDVPGRNDVGCARHDEVLLAFDEVRYHGHMVAVVVADTAEQARAAAEKVAVQYEPLPAILTIEDAVRADSWLHDPLKMERGDVDAALAAAPHRFAGTFAFGGQEQFYLEAQAAWAEVLEDGSLYVCSSTQHPSEIQAIVAEVLGVPRHRIVVESPRMGGGFGGKETQGNPWAALVALAARATGRPVRTQLDRDLDMRLTGKRHPFRADFQVGHDAEGRLLALDARLVADGGWSLDLTMPIVSRAMFHIDNAYFVPNLRVIGRGARTNLASNTAFRGFGGPQGMLVIEEILDRVARRLGLRPEDVRERNFYNQGRGPEPDTTHYGQAIEDFRIARMWPALLESASWTERRAAIDAWNAAHATRKRGLAVTPVKFGISFTFTPYNQAGAHVLMYQDATVQVNHGGTEMGQGLYAKILGVVMRELGLPAEAVRMMPTRTDQVPNTSATAASSGSDLNGAAVAEACHALRQRLAPVAAELLTAAAEGRHQITAEEVRFEGGSVRAGTGPAIPLAAVARAAYLQRVSLAATGFYATPGIGWDPAAGKGKPFHYFAYGVAATEVEVDGLTGAIRVRRTDILHDTGDSLNPGIDRGQIEGGFVQGMGWLTSEELKWDAEGRLLTHSASTYAIPAFSDAPADFRVTLLAGAPQTNVIHGSKAVGEPPLMLAISVREAIRDAVAAYASPARREEIPLASPATPEAVLTAIEAVQG